MKISKLTILTIFPYKRIMYSNAVCFLLGNSPASEFEMPGITQKKAYNIQNMAKV
jgi:hypothetical protein